MRKIAEMLYQAYLNQKGREITEKEESFFDKEQKFLNTLNQEQMYLYNKLESSLIENEENNLVCLIEYILTLLCPQE